MFICISNMLMIPSVLARKAIEENLWSIKTLLKGFEMTSCLKVNFIKSCLMGGEHFDEFYGDGVSLFEL